MPDYQALKAALADPQFAGLPDTEIAAALNAAVPVTVDTPIAGLLSVLLSAGDWPRVLLRAETRPATPIVMAAMQAEALAKQSAGGGMSVVQTSVPAIAATFDAALDGLRLAGDVSPASVTAIKALRAGTTTRAAGWGFSPLSVGDMQTARMQP